MASAVTAPHLRARGHRACWNLPGSCQRAPFRVTPAPGGRHRVFRAPVESCPGRFRGNRPPAASSPAGEVLPGGSLAPTHRHTRLARSRKQTEGQVLGGRAAERPPATPGPLGSLVTASPAACTWPGLLRPPCTRGHVTGRPLDLHTRLTVVFNPRNSGARQAQPHVLKDHARPPLSRRKRRYLFIRVAHTSVQITGRAMKPSHQWRTAFLVALPPTSHKTSSPPRPRCPGKAEEHSIY